MLLAAADTSSQFAFDASKENLGMVVMGGLVLVLWLLFRKMVELSERKKANDPQLKKKLTDDPRRV